MDLARRGEQDAPHRGHAESGAFGNAGPGRDRGAAAGDRQGHRLAQFYTRNDKVYEGTIHFGHSTDSYDADGVRTSEEVAVSLDRADLEPVLDRFRGLLSKSPPPVSAKKIAGRPAYELARKNQPVELAPVPVEVYSLDLLRVKGCEAEVRVHCSAGTYLRSIAHEAGQALGCGAFLEVAAADGVGRFQDRVVADSGGAGGAG